MSAALIACFIFLALGLLMFVGYLLFDQSRESPKYQVKKRLRELAMKDPSEDIMPAILKDEMMSQIPALHKALFRLPLARRLDLLIEQADVNIKVGPLILVMLVLFGAGALLGAHLHRGFLVTLVLAFAFALSPLLYLLRKKQVRFMVFTEQFPDALDMVARSLRAGHSFTSALYVVSQELPNPVSKIFRLAYEEQGFGLSMSEALNNMTRSINSLDLRFFITAVNIQRESGGNLAEILEKLGVVIRERFKILGQLRVYTAQGRLSGYILGVLPVAMIFVLSILNPKYLKILWETRAGTMMLVTGFVLQVLGFFVIRKIIKIKI